jgi:predicted glutamine amidotransferase
VCELLAMSSRAPTGLSLSMRRLASRGAPGGKLADGWGVACYDGFDARLVREPEPAGDSAWLDWVIDAGRPHSRIVIAHIRHMTQGRIALANTQPFSRELGGRVHVFAHNGMLTGIEGTIGVSCRRFRPVGETDSEVAFCGLLERMAPLWADRTPSVRERLQIVGRYAADLRALGPANFLYSDGELLFAHGHRRTQADGQIAPPGLTVLTRRCKPERDSLPAAGVKLDVEPDSQTVTLFASVPLTDEEWRPMGEGEIVMVRDGEQAPHDVPE